MDEKINESTEHNTERLPREDDDNASTVTELPGYQPSDPLRPRNASPAPTYRTSLGPPAGESSASSRAPSGIKKLKGFFKSTTPLPNRSPLLEKAWADNDLSAFQQLLDGIEVPTNAERATLGKMLHRAVQYQYSRHFATTLINGATQMGFLDFVYSNPDFTPNEKGDQKDTILHTALRYWVEEIGWRVWESLMATHAGWPPRCILEGAGITMARPLDLAAETGNAAMTAALLEKGATVGHRTVLNADRSVLKMLIENGRATRDICMAFNRRRKLGVFPRHKIVASQARQPVYKESAIPPSGCALANAMSHGSLALVEMLFELGASPNSTFINSLLRVEKHGSFENVGDMPILIYAVLEGGPEYVNSLIRHGAAVNARDPRGQTALHAAVRVLTYCPYPRGERLNIISTLLEHSAYIGVPDRRNMKPLDGIVLQLDELTLKGLAYVLLEQRYFETSDNAIHKAVEKAQTELWMNEPGTLLPSIYREKTPHARGRAPRYPSSNEQDVLQKPGKQRQLTDPEKLQMLDCQAEQELARVDQELEDFAHASRLLLKALEQLQTLVDEDDERTLLCRALLARNFYFEERFAEAAEMATQVSRVAAEGSESSVRSSIVLGQVRASTGQEEEAEQLLRGTLKVLSDKRTLDCMILRRDVLFALTWIYRRQDRVNEAEKMEDAMLSEVASMRYGSTIDNFYLGSKS